MQCENATAPARNTDSVCPSFLKERCTHFKNKLSSTIPRPCLVQSDHVPEIFSQTAKFLNGSLESVHETIFIRVKRDANSHPCQKDANSHPCQKRCKNFICVKGDTTCIDTDIHTERHFFSSVDCSDHLQSCLRKALPNNFWRREPNRFIFISRGTLPKCMSVWSKRCNVCRLTEHIHRC